MSARLYTSSSDNPLFSMPSRTLTLKGILTSHWLIAARAPFRDGVVRLGTSL